MLPAHNLAASYYERMLTGLTTLLVEKGFVTREDRHQRGEQGILTGERIVTCFSLTVRPHVGKVSRILDSIGDFRRLGVDKGH